MEEVLANLMQSIKCGKCSGGYGNNETFIEEMEKFTFGIE